jgi:hypothetical protein
MEVIDIGLSDLESVNLQFNDSTSNPSASNGVNFGPGIELLMNDKKKSASFSTEVDLGELNRLESELNELSEKSASSSETRTLSGFASNLFNFGGSSNSAKVDESTDSKLGHATVESIGTTKTWDGFSKMGEVPLSNAPKMSDRDRRRKKRAMLKKLEEWYAKGLVKNSASFNMDSPYEEI